MPESSKLSAALYTAGLVLVGGGIAWFLISNHMVQGTADGTLKGAAPQSGAELQPEAEALLAHQPAEATDIEIPTDPDAIAGRIADIGMVYREERDAAAAAMEPLKQQLDACRARIASQQKKVARHQEGQLARLKNKEAEKAAECAAGDEKACKRQAAAKEKLGAAEAKQAELQGELEAEQAELARLEAEWLRLRELATTMEQRMHQDPDLIALHRALAAGE